MTPWPRVAASVLAGDDESLVVDADETHQCVGSGYSADHREDGRCVEAALAISPADRHRFKFFVAVEGLGFVADPDLGVRLVFNAVNEVARHGLLKWATSDEMDLARVVDEVHRFLPGLLAAARDDDVLARRLTLFGRFVSVLRAFSLEPVAVPWCE